MTYYHLLFDRHEVILAEEAPTESLYTGPQSLNALPLATRREIKALFPEIADGAPVSARPIPNAKLQKTVIARLVQNAQPVLSL